MLFLAWQPSVDSHIKLVKWGHRSHNEPQQAVQLANFALPSSYSGRLSRLEPIGLLVDGNARAYLHPSTDC